MLQTFVPRTERMGEMEDPNEKISYYEDAFQRDCEDEDNDGDGCEGAGANGYGGAFD